MQKNRGRGGIKNTKINSGFFKVKNKYDVSLLSNFLSQYCLDICVALELILKIYFSCQLKQAEVKGSKSPS
jgi:uncharacterized protein YxjI